MRKKNIENRKAIIQLNSINQKINNIELIEGRLPIKNDEIVVESALIEKNSEIKIGDYIELNDETLELYKFQIVGLIKSPLYIGPETYSGSRGITNIGNGNINYYGYVMEDIIKTDYYPVIYITVKDAKNKITNSNEYKETIENAIREIETIKDENEKIRYNEIYDTLNNNINSKAYEGEKELNAYKEKLDEADKELKKEKNELETAKEILKKNTDELKRAKNETDKASNLLETKRIELNKYKKQLDEADSLISKNEAELDKANNLLTKNKEQLDEINNELTKAKEKLDESNSLLEGKKAEIDLAKDTLDKSKKELDKALEPYKLSYEKIKNIKDYIDTTSEKKETIISYIPKDILNYERVVEFISKIYDTTSDQIFEYIYQYSDIINSFINGVPKNWKSHDIIVRFLNSIKGRIDKVYSVNIAVNTITKGEEEYQKYYEQYNEAKKLYDSKNSEYKNQYALYEEAIKKQEEANNKYLAGRQELNNKKQEYKKAYSLYEQGLKEFNTSLNKYQIAYNQCLKGEKELEKQKNKWNESYNFYLSKLDEYNLNLEKYKELQEKFSNEIEQARESLEKISDSVWYLYDREDDRNYTSFLDAYNSIVNLSNIFPVIFYTLTVLVCMINMSRMVDEDRKEIGIFKALGTEKKHIIINYLLYAFCGTIIGSVLGAILGFWLLPIYIWNAYSVAFDIPNYEISYNYIYLFLGIIISIVLVEIATFFSTRKVLNESIISLSRPKLPKIGKKIFLENLPFIKKWLSFRNKIIIRNIFIYKKKIIMTILSTIGGILLILIGFSIKYSIANIVFLEYGKINTSDLAIYIDSNTNNSRIEEILDDSRIKSYQKVNISTVTTADYFEIYMQVLDEPYSNEINLYDSKTGQELSLVDGEVTISCKLAELLNKNVSDTIEIFLEDNSKKTLKISGISENHWGHLICMNKKTYENEFGDYSTNIIYLTLNDKEQENELIETLKQQNEVQSITSVKDLKTQIENILSPLNKIVVLLTVLSGVLTVVVLYNLAIINISERKKEIKILKTLGFTKKELDYYIITEMIFLAVIGITIGLLIGKYVCMYIVKSLEIEKARYIYKMMPQTYVYSTLLMIAFIAITGIFTHFGLNKIKINEK